MKTTILRRIMRLLAIAILSSIYCIVCVLLTFYIFYLVGNTELLLNIPLSLGVTFCLSAPGIIILWKYRKTFGKSKSRAVRWLYYLIFPEQLRINDPNIVEDGWQPGNTTRFRKIIHWTVGIIAVPISIAALIWTGYYIHYSQKWNRMLNEAKNRGFYVNISDINRPFAPDEKNAAFALVQAHTDLISSFDANEFPMNYISQLSEYALSNTDDPPSDDLLIWIKYRATYDPIYQELIPRVRDIASTDNEPVYEVPSLSRSEINQELFRLMNHPAMETFLNDVEAALDLPEMDLRLNVSIEEYYEIRHLSIIPSIRYIGYYILQGRIAADALKGRWEIGRAHV